MMSDKTFQWSLIAVVSVALLWIVASILLGLLAWGFVVLIGIIIALGGFGVLTHYWGKDYMERK